MIDPVAEIEAAKAEFISIRELFERLERMFPNSQKAQLAEWLIKKLCYESAPNVYVQGIAGKLTAAGEDWHIDDEDNNPFLTSLLRPIVEENSLPVEPPEQIYPEQVTLSPYLPDEYDDIPF